MYGPPSIPKRWDYPSRLLCSCCFVSSRNTWRDQTPAAELTTFFFFPLPSPPLSPAIAVLTFTQPQAFWVIQNVTQSLFVLIVSSGSRFTSSSPSTDANEWAASLDCQRWRWGESLVETCYKFFDTSLSAFWLSDVSQAKAMTTANQNSQ